MPHRKILKIHPEDNIVVALQSLAKGDKITLEEKDILIKQDIPSKHKFALWDFKVGEEIIMYGLLVGKATKSISQGDCISTENIHHASSEYILQENKSIAWKKPKVASFSNRQFLGYHRDDGKVGTANYWIVIPLVFCENRNLQIMKEAMLEELGYQKENNYKLQVKGLIQNFKNNKEPSEEVSIPAPTQFFENIDGIKFLSHSMGCGGTPEDARTLCGLLAGYINHSNVAGATVLSLGCQDAQVKVLKEEIEKRNPSLTKPCYIFEQQAYGTEKALLSEAIKQTFEGLAEANKIKREPAPLSKLVIGVECGGSDGFSGLSANPAIGYASDLTVALGGSVILSEFPELCGVEQELIDRCTYTSLAKRFIDIQRAYATKAEASGAGFYLNPSPGNIKDGLITDAIKSAGAVKKGGTSPVTDVLDYPGWVTKAGLNLLCTPGNDVESTTGLAGAGANIILFSTGLGTPTGNPVSPVIKISSNSTIAERMHDIIDIDAGKIISGEETIQSIGENILNHCIKVASGEAIPKAVRLGQDDFIPWKRGVSL